MKKVSVIILKHLSLCMLLAFLASSLVNGFMQLKQSSGYTKKLLEQYIHDTEQKIDYEVKREFIYLSQSLEQIRTDDPDWPLKELQEFLPESIGISEIHIISPEGVITESTQPELVGYHMDSGEQSRDFFENISRYGEYAQNCQCASYNSSLEMAYSGIRMEDGNYLQIGVPRDVLEEYVTDFLEDSTNHLHVGLDGEVVVVSKDLKIISSNQEDIIGKTLDEIGDGHEAGGLYQIMTEKGKSEDGSIRFREIKWDNVQYSCAVTDFYENYLIAIQPQKEAMQSQMTAIFIFCIAELAVFVILLIYVYHLIERRIVRNVHKVNGTLAEITAGKLDTTVDVRDSAEFSILSDDINDMVSSLKTYADRQKKLAEKDVYVASTIQLSALPRVFPPYPERKEFDLYATMHSAKAVGGDFYDFFFVGDDILALLIADVSGKGIPAAMFMMAAKTMIKNLAESGLPVEEVISRANDKLSRENASGMFVTVWMGYLNIKTGHLTYVNAGHNKPLLYHENDGYTYLKNRSGLAIALMEGVKYKRFETNLAKGDRIFLYTDGITEANNCKEELYSEGRLEQYLNQHARTEACSPKEVCENVKADVDTFAAGEEQFDDMTMLALTYFGAEEKYEVITIDAQIEKFPSIHAFLEENLEGLYCPAKTLMQLEIVAEEIFVNIAKYAYGDKPDGIAIVKLRSKEPGEVILSFIDYGMPYNPLNRADPDITLSEEERPVGGLGIFMVKKNVDDIRYKYEKNCNILTIVKRWEVEK